MIDRQVDLQPVEYLNLELIQIICNILYYTVNCTGYCSKNSKPVNFLMQFQYEK